MNKLIARSQADIDALFEVRKGFPDPEEYARKGKLHEVYIPKKIDWPKGKRQTDPFDFPAEETYSIEVYKPTRAFVYREKDGRDVSFWFWTKISG